MNDNKMELFLPGLLVLLISAIFVFMVIPKIGNVGLAVFCGLSLIAVLIHHSSMFASEYRLSTWQNSLSVYTPFIVLGIAILIIIGVALSLFTGEAVIDVIKTPIQIIQSGITASIQAMPTAITATNPVTSAINTTIKNNTKSLIPALGYRASNV